MSDLKPLFILDLLHLFFWNAFFRNWQNITEYEFSLNYRYVVCGFVCKIHSHFQGGSYYGQRISDIYGRSTLHSVIAAFVQL